MTTRQLVYWLAAMVALLVVGTTVGIIWADTSDAAGAFAGISNVIGLLGILILIGLAVRHHREGRRTAQ